MSYDTELKDKYGCTPEGNKDRFLSRYKNQLKYAYETNQWVAWDGTRWSHEEVQVYNKGVQSARAIFDEARNCDDTAGRKILSNWANASMQRNQVEFTLKLAAEVLSTSILEFDTDATRINCLNGIVDLETGKLMEHSPEQLVMKRANVEYKPEATSDLWNTFLEDSFLGNHDLITYVQRALGYSITGLVRDHHIFIPYGLGSNGKSTMFEVMLGILGDYAAPIDIEILLSNDKGNVRVLEQQGKLKGLRFAAASEPESNKAFSEGIVKRLTGGDTLTGAKLRGHSYDFKPTHHIWFQCNHLPRVKDASWGFWRRPVVIPFDKKLADKDKDLSFKEKLLADREGIFAWLVQGACDFLKHGLGKVPEVIEEKTAQYRRDNDILQRFIDDRIEKDSESRIGGSDMYRAYEEWCQDQQLTKVDIKYFPRNMEERGFARGKKGNMYYMGVRFKKTTHSVIVDHKSKEQYIEGGWAQNKKEEWEKPSSKEPLMVSINGKMVPFAEAMEERSQNGR